MTRKITNEMEQLYRLVHHDFSGLSYAEAAEVMGVSVRSVYRILAEMKKIAPQLFPILSKDQAEIWRYWHGEGLTYRTIAGMMELTEDVVCSKITTIRRKLGVSEPYKKTTVRMPSSQMDELRPDEITETF